MAHAAIVVSLAFVGAVMSAEPWPPTWVPTVRIQNSRLAFVGVMALWFCIHAYIRWQLRNRRIAAIYVAALLKVLRAWATTPPKPEDLKPWEEDPARPAKVHCLIDSLLIPWKWADVTADEGIKGYPTAFVQELQGARTGALKGEVIVSYGSLLLGLLLVVRAVS